MKRYTVAANTETRPLARGRFRVRSGNGGVNLEFLKDRLERSRKLTNASVHLAIEYIIDSTGGAP